ncbi:RNA polymerase sigma factor [Undibacterium sp. Xuan67W]|uniref:RNA polymerase sigma factor n=1 Tax=Undibacterium sp. Xuan67W TaxID=3413057 RepID=UPI003BF1660F
MFKKMGASEKSDLSRSSDIEIREVQLISLIAKEDRSAFEVLYRTYFSRLARFLDKMTRNTQLIEEIVNDTMLVVWQKAHTFNHTSKVSTWIFAIAYRQALKAINALDEPVDSDFESHEGDFKYEPEYSLSNTQLQNDVSRALHTLPLEQRVVVSLTYYHEMGYKEIAETMECPVNTVKTRMFHARQRLRIMLSGSKEET